MFCTVLPKRYDASLNSCLCKWLIKQCQLQSLRRLPENDGIMVKMWMVMASSQVCFTRKSSADFKPDNCYDHNCHHHHHHHHESRVASRKSALSCIYKYNTQRPCQSLELIPVKIQIENSEQNIFWRGQAKY